VLTASATTISESAPADRRAADIALLKRLRQEVVQQVEASRAFSLELSYEFAKVRAEIDKSLAYALLDWELSR
jgi:hypothetical protein